MHHSLVYKIRNYSGSCFLIIQRKNMLLVLIGRSRRLQNMFSGRHKRNILRAKCLTALF